MDGILQRRSDLDVLFPSLGMGLGLRPEHYSDVLNKRSSVSWFEVISENYLSAGGRPLAVLEKIRKDYSIALHGVSLSLGSADPLNLDYLKRLKELVHRFEPSIVSDHCCWTRIDGENLHDLMPLPFTLETARYVAGRIKRVQDYLGQRILIENVSSYFTFEHSEMAEWEFLSLIAAEADCGLLLDVNNVYVSGINHGFQPMDFLNALPRRRVGQIHLAGHIKRQRKDGRTVLIDTHDHPVCDEVWLLYQAAMELFGSVSTMIEWDANIPAYNVLELEIGKARNISAKSAHRNSERIPRQAQELRA